jgi:transcriptional regulator with XRE-family HTH domain
MSTHGRNTIACYRRIACEVDILAVFGYTHQMNPDPIYVHIGSIIRSRRKALRLTQEMLASRMSISRGGLANIETGRQNILVHQLYEFASQLNLEPSDFLPVMPREGSRLEQADLPLPTDLKKSQKEQIARFFDAADLNSDR